MDAKDEKYHRRCIELAEKGLGLVAPNPLVGAVLVYEDCIIGEGYHAVYGGPHAEVNAINAVKDKLKLKKSTLYVNLEPCAHFGKTPPCVDLIIKNKIPYVVIGQNDPYVEVAGKGIEKLKSEGVKVYVGFLENECRHLNRRFLTYHEKKRPYIILKWAETNDGYIDYLRNPGSNSPPAQITDDVIRPLVHKWRSEEQAILIGTNTAILDNPKLTVREWTGKNPIRMVIDCNLRLPENLNLFDKSQPTVVFTGKSRKNTINLEFHQIDFQNPIDEIFNFCYMRNIQSIIVEGGTRLISTFIHQKKWDEARVFKSNKSFGKGVVAPRIDQAPDSLSYMQNSILYLYHNY